MSITLKSSKNAARFKKITIVIAAIVVLVFGIVTYVNWNTSKEIPAVKENLNSFLILMSHEEYSRAYEMFSDKYKGEEDFETFKNAVIQLRPLHVGYKAESLETIKFTKRFYLAKKELHYEGQIVYDDTREIAEVYAVYILENEQWRLYGVEIFPPLTRLKNIYMTPSDSVELPNSK